MQKASSKLVLALASQVLWFKQTHTDERLICYSCQLKQHSCRPMDYESLQQELALKAPLWKKVSPTESHQDSSTTVVYRMDNVTEWDTPHGHLQLSVPTSCNKTSLFNVFWQLRRGLFLTCVTVREVSSVFIGDGGFIWIRTKWAGSLHLNVVCCEWVCVCVY